MNNQSDILKPNLTHSCPHKMKISKAFSWNKQGKSEGFDSCNRPNNLTQIGVKSSIFSPCDLEIWWMTPKNNRTPLVYYIKLCASFHCHMSIQTEVTVRKRPIGVKIWDFFGLSWPWNLMDDLIGHLFYTASSFVHHLIAISEYKLELQSRNTQFGSNSAICLSSAVFYLKVLGYLSFGQVP